MKSYRQYLLEADYTRFLKKNKNIPIILIRQLNTFFQRDKQAAKEFEKKYGWQSRDMQSLTWDDFEVIMGKSKTGRKINLNSIKIKGSKGKDYWPIRLKTKGFIANIPLNYETANYMNSCDYGSLDVDYCIGWDQNSSHWNREVHIRQNIPVYIVDGERKWVVMILPDNKSYEVWDKFNKEDVSKSKSEPIPGFSINKELIGGKMSKMYDDIRQEFYRTPHWIDDADISDAVYDILNDTPGGFLVWKTGIWNYGTWKDGIWRRGIWKDGIWNKGIWRRGQWISGIWENGIWKDGTWHSGIWEGGQWKGGTWLGGEDKHGNWHDRDDSPDKW